MSKLDEMDTTTLRNRSVDRRKQNASEAKRGPTLGPKGGGRPLPGGQLPPEPWDNTPPQAKAKKNKFDEGPAEDKPFGGMGKPGGFSIAIGLGGIPQQEERRTQKIKEKQTGTNVPMYIHNEKSAKSGHTPGEWAEDKKEAKQRGLSPAQYDRFENSPEAKRASIRSDINKSIQQIKRKK